MKTCMEDVRAHLVACMEMLVDESSCPDTVAQAVRRGHTLAALSKAYTDNVRAEIDAREIAKIPGLPSAISQREPLPALEQAK